MLPTPSTSHVDYSRIYEPAEDSFLFLDTLSSEAEVEFLTSRFRGTDGPTTTPVPGPGDGPLPPPLVVEVGTGSGVVVAFVTAQARHIFGTPDVLTAGVDVNAFACGATAETVRRAVAEEEFAAAAPSSAGAEEEKRAPGRRRRRCGTYLGSVGADLTSALRPGAVDVLLFNPPYVPTPDMPSRDYPALLGSLSPKEEAAAAKEAGGGGGSRGERDSAFARDSYLLELSYAGGRDGMETTNRLIESLPSVLSSRGCAYVLLCVQNRPDEVKRQVLDLGPEWRVITAGSSGKQAGWEKLQIIRIWREGATT